MEQVEVKFEGTDRSGLIAVGTYLIDAAGRLGVDVEDDCGRLGECDSCAMKIISGGDLLSAPTSAELKQLGEQRLADGERLSCQAKLEKAGEVVIMITQKNEENKPETEAEAAEEYRKKFEELPLEKKIASLVELEAIALGETFSFIVNSPYLIVGKIMDVMAEFGLKLDEKDREAKKPKEHQNGENGSTAKAKAKSKKADDKGGKKADQKESENKADDSPQS